MVYKNDPKNVLVKLEDYVRGGMYAFTISPEAQYYGEVDRVGKVVNYLKNKLRSPNIEYKLYIELSPSGRVHGHGWLWVANPYGFLVEDIDNLTHVATICIKHIDDPQKWEDYCIKQSHLMRWYIVRFLPLQSHDKVKTKVDDFI